MPAAFLGFYGFAVSGFRFEWLAPFEDLAYAELKVSFAELKVDNSKIQL